VYLKNNNQLLSLTCQRQSKKKTSNNTKKDPADAITEFAELRAKHFNVKNSDETLSLEEQYSVKKKEFASLCDIDTANKELRADYIQALEALHNMFVEPDINDDDAGENDDPDVDEELEKKQFQKVKAFQKKLKK